MIKFNVNSEINQSINHSDSI